MYNINTLNQVFNFARKNHGNIPMFFSKNANKDFESVTLEEVAYKAENLALALMDLGLEPKDKVGMMSDNRVEWAIADMAVIFNGAINVPRGSDSTAQEIQYILEHSESKFCFVEHEKLLKTLEPIFSKTQVKKWIVLDKDFKSSNENILSMYDLIKKGESLRKAGLSKINKRSEDVKTDDLFTIIYTSGTTGLPKGVMLSHGNMVYNIKYVPGMVGIDKGDRTLSILPVWHIFERAVDYCVIYKGASMAYTNIRDLRDDFAKIKPTFMGSAPRLWENIYSGIKAKLEKASEAQRMLFEVSYEICKNWRDGVDYLSGNKLRIEEEDPFTRMANTTQAVFHAVALFGISRVLDQIIFSKVRDVLGGAMKGTISGGGALPAHVDEFFNAIGIPVYEGYGMTECAPIISVRKVGHLVQKSVGFPPIGTDVRILDDKGNEVPDGKIGIIHVKGPQVMKGYYKNPDATAKTISKDGWLNTGDLGFRSLNGTISVRGRAKDTIVLLGGENVEPVPIENLLLQHPYIDQIIVVGQDQKTLTALIWPNYEKLAESGFPVDKSADLNKNKEIKAQFQGIIKALISNENGFKSFEKLTDFRFLPKAMEVGDEITNLFKMKRNVIHDKYAKLIQEMYQ
jgi:long-chain acyl-CoA synthetase